MRIIWLHGYKSAPGRKCELLRAIPGVEVVAPTITDWSPPAVRAVVRPLLRRDCVLIGSSLGGLLAMGLAIEFDLMAVLLNPVTRPLDRSHTLGNGLAAELDRWIGQTGPWENGQILAFVAMDDQVIDPKQTIEYMGPSCCVKVTGGHEMATFEDLIPAITAFIFKHSGPQQ